MKLQLIALSFIVIGCSQLLDVDGQKKVSVVRFNNTIIILSGQ